TVSANELFNKKDYSKSLENYKEALYRAEVLNNHFENCIRLKIPFIQAYVISCNNLAYTYEELGRLEEAESMLKKAIYYLLHFSGNSTLNKDEIQAELKKATLALVSFTEKNTKEKNRQERLISTLRKQLIKDNIIKPRN
ncbi:MAG: tetratricopeptide repeat protein, partial [Xanthomarina sp.]